MVPLLHHQHAQQVALMHDGCAKKRVERLFTEALDPLKLWMGARVIEVQRLLSCRYPAHQTLVKRQAKLAYLVFVQTLSRPKNQFFRGLVVKIDRANIGLHRGAHLRHDQHQGILQRVGSVHVLNQTSQHLEHYRLLLRRPDFRGLGPSEPVNCASA